MKRLMIGHVRGLVGAILGGVLGFYTFGWLLQQGFYGLMIPGALLGLGCGIAAGQPSLARGIACGVAAVTLAIYTQWHYWEFKEDDRFAYFITHLTSLSPVTLLMIAVGGVVAFWLGKDSGLRGSARSSAPPAASESPAPDDHDAEV